MASIGLVVANSASLASGETALQSLFEDAEHTVTVVDDGDTVPTGIDLFVITDPTSRGALGSKYTSIAVPVISLKPGAWQDLNLTSSGASNGGSGNGLSLLEHEITAGLGSSINHLASGSSGRWGVPTSSLGSGVETFAVHPSSSTHALGIAADEGATLTSGTAPARRVGLCYLDAVAANLSSNGATLLLQAVAWALGPEEEPPPDDVELAVSWSGNGLSPGTFTTSSAGTGDTAPGTVVGSTMTVTNDGPRPPRITWVGGDAGYAVWGHSTSNQLAYRWYHQVDTTYGGGYRLCVAWMGSGAAFMIDVNFAGALVLLGEGDVVLDQSSAGAVELGTWYRIEVIYDQGDTTVMLFEGDSTTPEVTLNAEQDSTNITEFWWGTAFNTTRGDAYGDDLAIAENTTTPIGPVASGGGDELEDLDLPVEANASCMVWDRKVPDDWPTYPGQQIIWGGTADHPYTSTSSGTGATFDLNDTSTYALGDRSIKVVTAGASENDFVRVLNGPTMDFTNRVPQLWIKVDDPSRMGDVNLWLGSGGNLSSAFIFNLEMGEPYIYDADGWVSITLPWSAAEVVGSPNRAALTDVNLQIFDSGEPLTLWWGGLASIPDVTGRFPNGVLTFTFDDGHLTDYTVAAPYLASKGWAGTVFPISDVIDTGAPYMSEAQLVDLNESFGWEIGLHSHTADDHNREGAFTALSTEEIRDNLNAEKSYLMGLGLPEPTTYAYPQGIFDARTTAAILSVVELARCTIAGTETAPPGHPGRVRCQACDAPVPVQQIADMIDDAVENGEWLIILFHGLVSSGAQGIEYNIDDFEAIVDYAEQAGIEVLPFREVYEQVLSGDTYDDTARQVEAAATVTVADSLGADETGRQVDVAATVAGVDSLAALDTVASTVTATVAAATELAAVDTLGIDAVGTLAVSDDLDRSEDAAVVGTATLAVADTLSAVDTVEADAASTVASTTVLAAVDQVALTVTGTLSVSDEFDRSEDAAVAGAVTVTVVDHLTAGDTLTVTATATAAGSDAQHTTDTAAVEVAATITSSDQHRMAEAGAVVATATVTADTVAAYADELAFNILATIVGSDSMPPDVDSRVDIRVTIGATRVNLLRVSPATSRSNTAAAGATRNGTATPVSTRNGTAQAATTRLGSAKAGDTRMGSANARSTRTGTSVGPTRQ